MKLFLLILWFAGTTLYNYFFKENRLSGWIIFFPIYYPLFVHITTQLVLTSIGMNKRSKKDE